MQDDDNDRTGVVSLEPVDTGPVPLVEGLSGLARGMSVIVVQRGPEIGQRFELSGERLTAGRSADSDILLDDVTVSRHHAQFVARPDGGWEVVDLGSLNGTYVNRASVERVELASGDLIQIGKFRLQYVHADEDHTAE
jgi:pSer/pThr/pTyr-binding forkhead associated (FHA) protein